MHPLKVNTGNVYSGHLQNYLKLEVFAESDLAQRKLR